MKLLTRLPGAVALRRAFTLIELLAVMLIISLLAVFLVPRVPDWIDNAKVTSCQANLAEIYKGVISFETKFGRLPNEHGVRFFGELITSGVLENTKANVRRMSCPGVQESSLGPHGLDHREWYADLSTVDGSYSAYAGRNTREFPLRRLSGREPLVGDDNDGGMNHATTTLVLYGDGTVERYELYDLRRDGLIGPDEILVVGPDSQIEDLRKLALD